MDEPIEETYFNWLYSKVARVENPTPSLTYYTLFRELHGTEFVWLLSGDDNRAEDGLALRRDFLRQAFLSIDEESPWYNIGCSVLEMLIAFAYRVEFQTDISARDWFWVFLTNLDLADLNDANQDTQRIANEVLNVFIWRTYSHNGEGGMFPLLSTNNDQRKVEIWYQFCEYVVDQKQ